MNRGEGQPQCARQRQVPEQMGCLAATIEDALKAFVELEKRLESVISVDSPRVEEGKQPEAPVVPLADLVRGDVKKVAELAERIRRLTSSLEV